MSSLNSPQLQYKTRIAIVDDTPNRILTQTLFSLLENLEQPFDYVIDDKTSDNQEASLSANEFVLLSLNWEGLSAVNYHQPNILLATQQPKTDSILPKIIPNMTAGGALIYEETDLQEAALAFPIKKFPYKISELSHHTTPELPTEEGDVPLDNLDAAVVAHIFGMQWLMQQMGVDMSSFYEALADF